MRPNFGESADGVVESTCPGCGSHLADTWTGDKCGCCGFAYVAETVVDPGTPVQRPDLGPSLPASAIAIVIAAVGGRFFPTIETTTTEGGLTAFSFAGGNMLAFTAFLAVATLLVTADSVRREFR